MTDGVHYIRDRASPLGHENEHANTRFLEHLHVNCALSIEHVQADTSKDRRDIHADRSKDNGHRPITITATVRGLPLHHGGLGIQRHSGISGQVGCLRSRSLTAAFVEEHFSEAERFGQAVASWPAMAFGAGHADKDPSQDQGAAVNLRDRPI